MFSLRPKNDSMIAVFLSGSHCVAHVPTDILSNEIELVLYYSGYFHNRLIYHKHQKILLKVKKYANQSENACCFNHWCPCPNLLWSVQRWRVIFLLQNDRNKGLAENWKSEMVLVANGRFSDVNSLDAAVIKTNTIIFYAFVHSGILYCRSRYETDCARRRERIFCILILSSLSPTYRTRARRYRIW